MRREYSAQAQGTLNSAIQERKEKVGIFAKFSGKREERKAIAFVDYEHWFYSYQNLYGLRPDPSEWRKNLETDFHITPEDIMVFADFSKPGINSEIEKLRAVTNTIIETQQAFNRHKKDMTDFIMLDFIYQTAAQRKDINTYILFTGDGHFQSVVKYLIQRLRKEVIVFGVKDAVSNRLKDVASEYHEIPYPSEMKDAYYRMIVSNMDYVFDKPEIIPTFMSTVQAVSERNRIPESNIYSALNEMIDEGLIYKREQTVNFNRVKVIAADWDALKKAGYWDPEKKQER